MKILESNHQVFDLKGFNKVDHSEKQIGISGEQLTAGKSWKGKLVSALETFGIFKEYCADFRKQETGNSQQAAWELFGGLKGKYGADTVDAALESTKDRFHGMDLVRVNRGIVPGEGEQASVLTCGEVRSLMDESAAIDKYLALHPKPQTSEMGTQTDAPDVHEMEVQTEPVKGLKPLQKLAPRAQIQQASTSTETQATSTGTDEISVASTTAAAPSRTELITTTIANHSLTKSFVKERENLRDILTEMGEPTKRLSGSRAEFVASRVLREVREMPAGTKLTEADVRGMVKEALTEALSHNSAWSRIESIKISADKRLHAGNKGLRDDIKALVAQVKINAEAYITKDYISTLAQDEGVTLNKFQTKFAMKEAIESAVLTAEQQGIGMDTDDFKDIAIMMIHSTEGKSQARLLAGL